MNVVKRGLDGFRCEQIAIESRPLLPIAKDNLSRTLADQKAWQQAAVGCFNVFSYLNRHRLLDFGQHAAHIFLLRDSPDEQMHVLMHINKSRQVAAETLAGFID